LAAFTANNQPSDDWGPKKRANQYGAYAHLNHKLANTKDISNQYDIKTSTETNPTDNITGIANPAFFSHSNVNDSDELEQF
jgi:hypothetical protein